MRYFTEEIHDIEGYHTNLLSLSDCLNEKTFDFFLNNSLHDSTLVELTALSDNDENKPDNSEESIVSVSAKLKSWDDKKIELIWEDVTRYSIDFDITRNRVIGTGQILFNRGLDEWSHDELTRGNNGRLKHEIYLFSQTTIIIEFKNLVLIR